MGIKDHENIYIFLDFLLKAHANFVIDAFDIG